ncbi:type I-C CRISPR-associated protein Cas5c [Aeoliella mucimassa]|uniref:pre-crRNA processing endonuclease n=1 Tax=Aeoliella mucimassa TaxID=2527972 RepID=A0A518AQM0_9BACT|nr:type I-C CRISPR-associated protein Cas5c [Aeoliella mucimassa]QDU57016.1 CRISPR-associated protein Cas5 [Aeoliella mucimassa]
MTRSPIALRVWGDYACFSRPECKVERLSYDVITPSAARGILEAIYWKPQVQWIVERIHVYREPEFTNLRRNEVASKASATNAQKAMKGTLAEPLALYADEDRQQRAATILRDVEYIIEARFDLLDDRDPVAKHYNMFKRRAEKGQCFHRPYLGTREFACHFAWVEGPIPESPLTGERDLSWMLGDMAYTPLGDKQVKQADSFCSHTRRPLKVEPQFFRAIMRDGVIEVPSHLYAPAEVTP